MARRRALAALLALLLCVCSPAHAQQLAQLTVTSFTLGASTTRPSMEVPFDLVVRLHVKERVTALDNLNLPLLSDLELLGDERRYTADATGTSYVEVVRVVAHHTGRIDIAPATLDAIDALDGKAKRYSTNALTVVVGGGPIIVQNQNTDQAFTETFGALTRMLLVALAIVVLVVAGIIVLIVRLARRAPQPAYAAATPLPVAMPVPPPRTQRELVADAVAALRANPTRQGAVAARRTVRELVGAGVRETLSDVLQRPGTSGQMALILRALERAAFTTDADLTAAITQAVDAMERL